MTHCTGHQQGRRAFGTRWQKGDFCHGKNTSISLGDHFKGLIEAQVQTGRYGSASDVVRAELRLLEEREAKVKALEASLIAGEQSGAAFEAG